MRQAMCGNRARRRQDYFSDRQDAGSAEWIDSLPRDGGYLVSDAEREAVLNTVRRHTAAGRLTVAEFSARTDQALLARTADDLRAALDGLPAPAPVPSPRGSTRHAHSGHPRIPALAVVALI